MHCKAEPWLFCCKEDKDKKEINRGAVRRQPCDLDIPPPLVHPLPLASSFLLHTQANVGSLTTTKCVVGEKFACDGKHKKMWLKHKRDENIQLRKTADKPKTKLGSVCRKLIDNMRVGLFAMYG